MPYETSQRYNAIWMESGDWQMVKKKKSAKKDQPTIFKVEMSPQLNLSDSVVDCNKLIQRINVTMENLRVSGFWDSCQTCLHRCPYIPPIASHSRETDLEVTDRRGNNPTMQHFDCVCYGLGHFSSCVISRDQLAFLLLFLEQFKIPRCQAYVFDPVFSPMEISLLQKLGLNVVFENEEGKHVVHKPTVFYMLHCGKALYNNLLWRNWSQDTLPNMIIIGNSFKGIEERLLSRILQRDYLYIHQSLQVVEEAVFPNHPQYSDVFNDTSIHWFPIQKLQTLANETWQLLDEPHYQECEDLEIIRKQKRDVVNRCSSSGTRSERL
ncbi:SRR1-like protein [Rhinophrynus dorsalis]